MFRALIADNDHGVNGLLAELVRRAGFEVDVAFDGEEALIALARGGYSLLVCDLDMPKKDGKEVLTALSGGLGGLAGTEGEGAYQGEGAGNSDLDRLVVFVVTGFLDDVIAMELEAMPLVRQTFRKPFDVAEFQGVVAGLREALEATEPRGGSKPDASMGLWGSVSATAERHAAGSQTQTQTQSPSQGS